MLAVQADGVGAPYAAVPGVALYPGVAVYVPGVGALQAPGVGAEVEPKPGVGAAAGVDAENVLSPQAVEFEAGSFSVPQPLLAGVAPPHPVRAGVAPPQLPAALPGVAPPHPAAPLPGVAPPQFPPPQRFFNFEEVAKVWDRKLITKRGNAYVFGQDTYRNGFIEKDIKTSALITEDVNPSLEEITMFAKQDGTESADGSLEANIDLSIISNAAKKAAITVLQPGDHVEVFEGEQSGVHGSVDSITNEIATLRVEGFDLEGQRVEVPAKSVRKRFRIGDHVKVMSGKNQDETGLVVSVEDNIVTFISDMTNKEVSNLFRLFDQNC